MIARVANINQIGNNLVQLRLLGQAPALALMTFNDPARMNAMSQAMAGAFRARTEFLKETRPGAVVVTGAGPAFSAGDDMEMMRQKQGQTAEVNAAEMLSFYRSFLGILDLKVPLVAAINGPAIGAALCFACACDKRVVVNVDQDILGFSFAKRGLAPGMGGTVFPQRLVGKDKADEMLARGYNISPRKAFAIGMVEMVVPKREVLSYSIDLAMKLALQPRGVLRRRVGWHDLKRRLSEEARIQLRRRP